MDGETALELAPRPSCGALFLAFLEISACSFGGAATWARRILVEKRGWLSDTEFTELFGMNQVLPGPNVTNMAFCLGDRYRGAPGSLSAVAGLLVPATAVAILLDRMVAHFIHRPSVAAALAGISAAAGGLVVSTAVTMAVRWKGSPLRLLVAVAAAAAQLLGFPLLLIVAALAPLGVFLRGSSR